MTKKVQKSVKNEKRGLSLKMKKGIRRVIAGMCLVSAVLIAAVPSDHSGVAQAVVNGNDAMNYTSDYSLARNGDLSYFSGTSFLDPTGFSQQFNSYEIREIDGKWQLLWKYRYYVPASGVNGNTNVGIICGYNDTYSVDSLSLTSNIISGYEFVAKSTFDTYVQNTVNPISYMLDVSPYTDGTSGTKVADVERYYPTEFAAWRNIYDTKLAEYKTNNSGMNPSSLADLGMNPLILSGIDMSEDNKKIYYCEHNLGLDGTTLLSGYTLVPVSNLAGGLTYKDYSGGASTIPNEDLIYIAMYNSDSASSANLDENNFKYLNSQGIVGISEAAFANTKKVKSMNVGDGIAYIGDGAFENSFIQKVEFSSVIYIGNRVFKGCQYLGEINLAEKTEKIGKEAFYGCKILKNVTIPSGVQDIGFGAFAGCSVLETLDFTQSHGVRIGEYAFYDCPYLTNVNFTKDYEISIGKAAFALTPGTGTNAKLENFVFPEKLTNYQSDVNGDSYQLKDDAGTSYNSRLGDYILAGRNNLKTVTLPLNFGSSNEERVPMDTFDQCVDLEHVDFAKDNNRLAVFDTNLFEDVENEEFYVFGPEATLSAGPDGNYYAMPRRSTWNASTKVSDYIPYVYNDGKDHYEVGIGDYRYELEVNNSTNTAKLLSCEFIVPAQDIDELIVPSKVASYSITEMEDGCLDGIKDYVIHLVVEDNSIEAIGDNVFADCDKLLTVQLGNSVKTIGNQAFANNLLLTDVEIGNAITTIGDEAFTNCPKLNNVIWDQPANVSQVTSIGTNAFFTTSDKLYFHGIIDDGYLPFTHAMGDNKINVNSVRICYTSPSPSNLYVIKDESSNKVLLIDYPHYSDLPSDLRTTYEAHGALNDEQLALLNATLYLSMPDEIQSIDVASFLNDDANNPNRKNWVYVDDTNSFGGANFTKQELYGNKNLQMPGTSTLMSEYYDSGYYPGNFSCYTIDSTALAAYGEPQSTIDSFDTKGNDWLLSVEMPGVEEIPDYAFDSCERLQSVIIAEDCNKIGTSAFQGCDGLTSIGTNNNPNYSFDNYILYEKLSDGSYEINTCLSSRGNNRSSDEIWINADNDPNLLNTSSLNEGAFASCKNLAKADLSESQITAVPTKCFDGCTSLTDVELPKSINNIARDSFANGSSTLDITIPCDSQISDEAFDKNATVTIWTYPECSITANYDPVGYNEIFVKYMDTEFTITFLNDDLSVYEEISVQSGKNGYYPDNNPLPILPEHSGYTFSHWYFDNTNGIKNVTENRQALAVFVSSSSATNPSGSPSPSASASTGASAAASGSASPSATPTATATGSAASNISGYLVTVENGAGGGYYEAGKVVTITSYAATTGRVFDKWTTSNADIGFSNALAVSTTFIMPTHDVKVTATYKSSSASANATASASATSTATATSSSNPGNQTSTSNNVVRGDSNTGTEVTITTDTIDNNNKNLASATVSGSTDNFVVKITDSASSYAAAEQALRDRYGDAFDQIMFVGFDISLYDSTGTTLIENYDGLAVTITIPIPDQLVDYAGNNKAAAVVNGSLQEMAVQYLTIDGVPCMRFTATHFSPYTIFVDTGNLVSGVADSTPKTGDGIAPKWFLSVGLLCISSVLFLWKDKKRVLRNA